jgi:hypothetical protein
MATGTAVHGAVSIAVLPAVQWWLQTCTEELLKRSFMPTLEVRKFLL